MTPAPAASRQHTGRTVANTISTLRRNSGPGPRHEVTGSEYVIAEPDEPEQIAPGHSRTIDMVGFVDLADAYALLVEALERVGWTGPATFAMRGEEYLAAVRSKSSGR